MRAADLYHLQNPSPSARFEPANLGCNVKDASHYTTEDDFTYLDHETQRCPYECNVYPPF
jgi:hypothetical protein